MPRRWALKISTRLYYTPSQTIGQYNTISRDGNLKEGPTRRHATCLNKRKFAEAIYEGGAASKNNQREESDHASYGRKKKGGPSALPSNPEKGRSGKRKRTNAGHTRDDPTGAKKTCLLHGPGHS